MASVDLTDKYKKEQIEEWFPKIRSGPAEDTYEIALVLAGAVSAGAFTAGVVDFLIEALDELCLTQAGNHPTVKRQDVPRHKVRLRIVTGASAGGINGAILAKAAPYAIPHRGDPEGNPFHQAWVKRIDIGRFLEKRDLGSGRLYAALDTSVLDEIAREIVAFRASPAGQGQRDWLMDPTYLSLTVSNLRGIPYGIQFQGSRRAQDHAMTLHADVVTFAFSASAKKPPAGVRPDAHSLDPGLAGYDREWKALGETALATGAFPLALRARLLGRPDTLNDIRLLYWSQDDRLKAVSPSWPEGTREAQYSFLNVDGGLINNEPFDIAHAGLAGLDGNNPREADEARRTVIMIDPFVDPDQPGPGEEQPLARVLLSLVSTLKEQARFKPADLLRAADLDLYSRRLITPSRGKWEDEVRKAMEADGLKPPPGGTAIASGALGAFLGFFAEAYRQHDFELGRRNCQKFLKDVFVLPKDAPIVAGNYDAGHLEAFASNDKDRKDHVQIIPLVGSAADEVALPPWPAGAYAPRRKTIEAQIKDRLEAVVDALKQETLEAVFGGNREEKTVFNRTWDWARRQILRKYIEAGWWGSRELAQNAIFKSIEAAVADVEVLGRYGPD